MSYLRIQGGTRLNGDLAMHGAKNSVLPILAATILTNGESIIHNCPELLDVDCAMRILRHLGCTARREGGTVIVDTTTLNRYDIPDCLMREMRSSFVFLGAILGRCGQAMMSTPGGCQLGLRPVDLHLLALRAMGAAIREEGGTIHCTAPQLTGCGIYLSFPSVGATENAMLAACAARGVTRIHNAACEPEISDLADYLRRLGVRISGVGTSTVTVEGPVTSRTAEHTVISDRIAASTYMAAVAAAGGDVTLANVDCEAVSTVVTALTQAGCEITARGNTVRVVRDKPLRAINAVRTMPYPGFPTDAQAPLMAVMARAAGVTIFVETIFENRYRHVGELARMGADIRVEDRVAVVCGVPRLYGAPVDCTDLRGGAALLIAGLCADGETHIGGIGHIDRGYERVEWHLKAIGADVERINDT